MFTIAQTRLEPYAASIILASEALVCASVWQEGLAFLLDTVALECHRTGAAAIGHIKAIALFPDGGYLSASVVSQDHPTAVSGTAPPCSTDMKLTLNALVYGLPCSALEKIVKHGCICLARQFPFQVDLIHNGDA